MGNLGPTELIIIGLIVVLLFGAKKLPDTAKALGQSLRLFKRETSKLREEDEEATVVKAQAESVPPPQVTAASSVEDRLRALEEENRRLKATAEPTVNGVPLSQAQNEQRPS
ncbi:Sec-independent protein translocase subunit TatA [Planotetraspora sp. A-T 1434]|uniref:Sec-independent protein translocase subunit TatA n=1 Tax=Planotetraspora sp. A-T 1434 TaxID=2979219 RepID=UPI0021C16A08|nr:Sec-independent protein translocase subunit TatA [Planotetraspora sp. A-T 1434]MCT9934425.1 Sec-independent protein translocase subunit TatA [Planotetraspora sp. A-T 1434]